MRAERHSSAGMAGAPAVHVKAIATCDSRHGVDALSRYYPGTWAVRGREASTQPGVESRAAEDTILSPTTTHTQTLEAKPKRKPNPKAPRQGDFEELTCRNRAYLDQERMAREDHVCRIGLE